MLISSGATGGQITSADAERRFYDDIGCLAADVAAIAVETTARRIYVRVSGRDEWIQAIRAHYAELKDERTPMGSGLVAFTSEAEARAADRNGRARSWNDVVSELEAMTRAERRGAHGAPQAERAGAGRGAPATNK